MGGVVDMAAYVAGALERVAVDTAKKVSVGRSPGIALSTMITTPNRRERDRAWLDYAKRLRRAGEVHSSDHILGRLEEIWEEELFGSVRDLPAIDIELVGHPAREYVEGEYTPPPQPEPTTVEDEELFMALVDQLNILTRNQILAKWSVKPSANHEGGWVWEITAILGTGTRLKKFLTTKQVSQAIDEYLVDTRKDTL